MFKKILDEVEEYKQEVVLNYPIINITNNRVEIGNYKRIFKLTKTDIIIVFQNTKDNVEIIGKNLLLKKINKEAVIVLGKVHSVVFMNRGEKDE